MRKMKQMWYKIHQPKLKAKYQFGSPIVGVYAFNEYLVVATKLDIYISTDGITYQRVERVWV
jgi:hypothetical protein